MRLRCPDCGEEVDVGNPWDMLCNSTTNNLHCENCLSPLELNFDEGYNEETGETTESFWLSYR